MQQVTTHFSSLSIVSSHVSSESSFDSLLLNTCTHFTHNMNNIHGYGEDSNSGCYFHPKEVFVGVCPLCLNEKLLVLAAKQGQHSSSSSARTSHHHNSSNSKINVSDNKKPPIYLPKIFTLGTLLNRFEFRHWKSDVSDDHEGCSSSQEGNFILFHFYMLFFHLIMIFLFYWKEL